jgi:hypothetical protein
MTNPGVYCLRTNELTGDETTLWQTCIMLIGLESVFRGLKSELGYDQFCPRRRPFIVFDDAIC